eukprot:TRINITY_DN1473_c0_g1_i10.p1 TRINITY_DN1473_c0_g1~~TRINITY_DN1473_c0_g1_i10.p1  ORF type:complete len:365 (+),score=73.36 TRINITY_DN1473_c0_g1_i10:381-1475(+)
MMSMMNKIKLVTEPFSFSRSITRNSLNFHYPRNKLFFYRTIFSFPESDKQKPTNHDKYCTELVRKADIEGYLASLFMPPPSRRAAFCVRAFNIELALIKDKVTEQHLGRVRLTYYRDLIKKIYNETPLSSTPSTNNTPTPNNENNVNSNHGSGSNSNSKIGEPSLFTQPLAISLSEAVKEYKLSRTWFLKMIERRERELNDIQPYAMKDIEAYAEDIYSSILYLMLECNKVKSIQADHAASHIGRALGIMTVLRAIPFHAQNRNILLPLELTTKYNIIPEDLFKGFVSEKFPDLVYEMASEAKIHLDKAKELASSLPPNAHVALLPAVICEDFLNRLQQLHFDVFNPLQLRRHPFLPLKVWWAH